jgi:hypothetical protein
MGAKHLHKREASATKLRKFAGILVVVSFAMTAATIDLVTAVVFLSKDTSVRRNAATGAVFENSTGEFVNCPKPMVGRIRITNGNEHRRTFDVDYVEYWKNGTKHVTTTVVESNCKSANDRIWEQNPDPTRPPTRVRTRQCFPAAATVSLPDGSSKAMSDLQVGDAVLSVGTAGALSYQPVYFFGHRKADGAHPFFRLATKYRTLLLSGDHFLLACRASSDCSKVEAFVEVPAKTVRKEDSVLVLAPGAATPVVVVSIEPTFAVGLFNPYTLNGRIVVDGVAASAHSSSVLDPLFHALGIFIPAGYQAAFAPLRLLYRLLGADYVRWVHPAIDLFAAVSNGEPEAPLGAAAALAAVVIVIVTIFIRAAMASFLR